MCTNKEGESEIHLVEYSESILSSARAESELNPWVGKTVQINTEVTHKMHSLEVGGISMLTVYSR